MIRTKGGTYFRKIELFDLPETKGNQIADTTAQAVMASGKPELSVDELTQCRFGFPVFRNGEIISIAVCETKSMNEIGGVIELWQPVGRYEEVRLTSGAFGKLERFQNVSCFVRFEKGSGLPGQVWASGRSMIHDDLSNHPAFLRAAGASADSLQIAIGIPIIGDDFVAALVMISPGVTPLARGFEIWSAEENGFRLIQATYPDLDVDLRLKVGEIFEPLEGLPGLASEHGGMTTTENDRFLYAGRNSSTGMDSALSIPTYHGDRLDSVTTLLF
jgi:hypothetical protein